MQFIGKITGTNNAFDRLKDKESNGELNWQGAKDYELIFDGEKFFYQIYNFVIEGNHIEFEGYLADENQQVGRVAIQIEPLVAK